MIKKHQWTWMNRYFYSVQSLGICPRVVCLDMSSFIFYCRSTLSFLKTLHTSFHSGCTSLSSNQKWLRVPLYLHPHQHLSFFVLGILAILTGIRWNHKGFLICISLMTKDVEQILKYSSAVYVSSLENSLFLSLSRFWIGLCKLFDG